MIRSLFMTLIYLSFLGLGMAAPFILTLGYVWVDTFRPQSVAWYILNQLPVALIMGVAALAGYFLMDRRSPPRLTLTTLLTLLLGCWVTATMYWAEVPLAGWAKWDWAFKTVMFSAFIPLVIRSRVQIEAFAQVYVFTLAANFIPFAAKVLISGGGYGHNLGLIGGNGNLAEGGLLSIAVLMTIPLALHLGRHTQLLPRTRLVKFGYIGVGWLCPGDGARHVRTQRAGRDGGAGGVYVHAVTPQAGVRPVPGGGCRDYRLLDVLRMDRSDRHD